MNSQSQLKALKAHRTLVLNADFQPLTYFPLSVMDWQDTIRAVFLGRVQVVHESNLVIHSPSLCFRLPTVVVLREYVPRQSLHLVPRFTAEHMFHRDQNTCLYCGSDVIIGHSNANLRATVDHVVPSSRGGENSWTNCVTSCMSCNLKKADKTPQEASMPLLHEPFVPTQVDLLYLWLTEEKMSQYGWHDFIHVKARPRLEAFIEAIRRAA